MEGEQCHYSQERKTSAKISQKWKKQVIRINRLEPRHCQKPTALRRKRKNPRNKYYYANKHPEIKVLSVEPPLTVIFLLPFDDS